MVGVELGITQQYIPNIYPKISVCVFKQQNVVFLYIPVSLCLPHHWKEPNSFDDGR